MSARPPTPTQVAAMNPDYGDHQARTTRKIPVVVLSPS
jgi:F420H(2)-dependent quinone reductase